MRDSTTDHSLLEVRNIDLAYGVWGFNLPFLKRVIKPVVHDVSLSINIGETVALVGESGSGKTTIARAIAGMISPIRGQIILNGKEIATTVERRTKETKRQIQFVFQNPDASLNPRRKVAYSIGRPLELFFGLSGAEKTRRVEESLLAVGLNIDFANRFPTQLSGGERQRVAIARALAAQPKLMLCDEIVSALDVSVQANTLDLLKDLQEKNGIAYLFIAHNLAVVRWLADRVGVLYLGRLLEIGSAEEVFSPPSHPYTEMLLRSVPEPDANRNLSISISDNSEPIRRIEGLGDLCPFLPRCPYGLGHSCEKAMPEWLEISPRHGIRCHLSRDQLKELGSPNRQ